jgi:trehalose 6-phosphate synthase/phosphatase
MSQPEKEVRHAKLYKVVTTHTSHTWAAVLVKQLLSLLSNHNQARQTPYIPKDRLVAQYEKAKKRLFLLDYDVGDNLWCFATVMLICVW